MHQDGTLARDRTGLEGFQDTVAVGVHQDAADKRIEEPPVRGDGTPSEEMMYL